MAEKATETTSKAAPKAKAAAPGEPYKLTLREKLVELRKACPKITKENTGDGVKYKFNKIDDVWARIVPVMNEIGIDFEICEEIATKHAPNGDLVYVSEIATKTYKGAERLMFCYECDLKIKWTNLENEDDVIETVVHAIGWNDDPAKAKGCAHTYALKYYLFERFSIDQGEDDPDQFDNSAAGRAPKPLTDAQMQRLYKKGEACGMAPEAVNQRIWEKFGKQNPTTLTIDEYNGICASLDAYLAKINGG